MGRLARLAEKSASNDILTVAGYREKEEQETPGAGPVKTTIDLNLLERFVPANTIAVTVSKYGTVRISNGAVKCAPEEYQDIRLKGAIYLNKRGNIIVIQPSDGEGYSFNHENKKKTSALRTTARKIIRILEERGVTFPARFNADWDEELQAWVGRL